MSGSRRMVMSGSSAAGGIKGATPGAEDDEAGQLTPSVWLSPPENEGLAGKTAIVTGAGRNLGRAIALALGDAGANVVVNARSNSSEAEAVTAEVNAGNGRAIAAVGDVGDAVFDQRMVQQAIDEFGAVDVLVNNAGVRKRRPILEITPEDWDETIRSNLSAMFYLTRLVLPGMIERRWGRIINIGGPDGQSGSVFRAHNVTCKAGLIGLAKAITAEVAHLGVTANVVVPGVMDTTRDLADYPHWPPSQETLSSLVPAARLGTPDELAYACRFLASNAASYISGQTLHVNGGYYMP